MTQEDVQAAPRMERSDPYEEWQRAEGAPIVGGIYLQDLYNLEVGPWARKGCNGAICYLDGDDDTDEHVVEIPPGGSTTPERHMYTESVYILKGRGATTVWYDDKLKQTFEWGNGSFFTPPVNTWVQHFNGSGSEPARFIAVTNLPHMMRQFISEDFLFNNPFVFSDRFLGEQGYFSGEGKLYRGRVWETNFVPNADNMGLYPWGERGGGGTNIMLSMADNMVASHISEFPTGTYKKAHRHGSGAHLMVVGGVGFSLLWREGEERIKADWQKGSMYLSGGGGGGEWFHQHFNAGPEPARYLVMGAMGSRKYARQRGGANEANLGEVRAMVSIKLGGIQVEYEDEDPEVHQIYEQELASHGATCRMKNLIPSCTGIDGPTNVKGELHV